MRMVALAQRRTTPALIVERPCGKYRPGDLDFLVAA
jgi:hypothetical protein